MPYGGTVIRSDASMSSQGSRQSRLALVLLSMFCLMPHTSVADVIEPTEVLSTSYWGVPPVPLNLISGTGLSTEPPEIEMKLHICSDTASHMWHAGPIDGGLGGPTGNPPEANSQSLVFDLGSALDLDGAYVWAHNQNSLTSRSVNEFEILVSADADALTATFHSMGIFSLEEADVPDDCFNEYTEPAQFVGFIADNVRLVKFDVNTTHSGAEFEYVGLSEVRFSGSESTPQCSDGLDNDSDFLVDFPDDPGCVSGEDNDELDEPEPPECSDSLDNDSDGFTDFPDDPGCESLGDDREGTAQCSDFLDNDSDGLIDFPADPDCVDAADDWETPGPEAGFIDFEARADGTPFIQAFEWFDSEEYADVGVEITNSVPVYLNETIVRNSISDDALSADQGYHPSVGAFASADPTWIQVRFLTGTPAAAFDFAIPAGKSEDFFVTFFDENDNVIQILSELPTPEAWMAPLGNTIVGGSVAFGSSVPIFRARLEAFGDGTGNGTFVIWMDNLAYGESLDVDLDEDGLADSVDNCVQASNADQRDSDSDGFGNVCDADLNNDCNVNATDLGMLKAVFFSTDSDADINGDGAVNALDLGAFKSLFFQPPGPSGLVACP